MTSLGGIKQTFLFFFINLARSLRVSGIWAEHQGHVGFEVRRRYTNESLYNGKATHIDDVCTKEGHQEHDKRDHVTRIPDQKQEHVVKFEWILH